MKTSLVPVLVVLALSTWALVTPGATVQELPSAHPGSSHQTVLSLDPKPKYVNSGAWAPGGHQLLIVDQFNNQLKEISADTGEVTIQEMLDGNPTFIRPLPGFGYLISYSNPNRWELWSLALELKKAWECAECSISNWVPVRDDLILGVGEVNMGDEDGAQWVKGIFWVSPKGPELALGLDSTLPMYMIGQPFLAVVDGRAYALLAEGVTERGTPDRYVQIVEVPELGGSPRVLARLPEPAPRSHFMTMGDVRETFAQIGAQRMPAALLGWEGGLYLVNKDPLYGYTLWRMNPSNGYMKFLERLETDAPFITVVPGDRQWAFLLKGAMEGFGQQDHRALQLIAAHRLRD